MTGGLIQLVSRGVLDAMLTDSPEITYFKTVYRRYTNYAIETFEEIFHGMCNFGNVTECHLGKYGDLLSDILLKVELPSICERTISNNVCVKGIMDCFCDKCNTNNKKTLFSWANAIGHVMIEYVELQIGSKIIDKQYGEWLEIWTELSQTNEKRPGYNEMIGKKEPVNFTYTSFPNAMSLLIPMNFWFCRNIGSALPVIGLFYEDVIIRIKWRDFHNCYVSNIPGAKAKPINGFTASLYVDYVFLDIVEREKFIAEPQTYIIDQIQFIEYSFSKAVKHPKIDLNSFHHPVKELIWILQRDDVHQHIESALGNDWFNYGINKNRLITNKNNVNETFTSARLLLNGVERIKDIKANYYRLGQPYKFHTRIPANYIYMFSFCLKPEEQQPTGICNFSLYTNINLQLTGVQMTTDYSVKVYAVNLNFMLIDKGLCGIAEL